jgi:hypothetical protein
VWFNGGQYAWHDRSLIDANYLFHGNEDFSLARGDYDVRADAGSGRS